jgi:hypothetical protein
MADQIDVKQHETQKGERMIEVRIRFLTDELAEGTGMIRPKHAGSRKETSHTRLFLMSQCPLIQLWNYHQ